MKLTETATSVYDLTHSTYHQLHQFDNLQIYLATDIAVFLDLFVMRSEGRMLVYTPVSQHARAGWI